MALLIVATLCACQREWIAPKWCLAQRAYLGTKNDRFRCTPNAPRILTWQLNHWHRSKVFSGTFNVIVRSECCRRWLINSDPWLVKRVLQTSVFKTSVNQQFSLRSFLLLLLLLFIFLSLRLNFLFSSFVQSYHSLPSDVNTIKLARPLLHPWLLLPSCCLMTLRKSLTCPALTCHSIHHLLPLNLFSSPCPPNPVFKSLHFASTISFFFSFYRSVLLSVAFCSLYSALFFCNVTAHCWVSLGWWRKKMED